MDRWKRNEQKRRVPYRTPLALLGSILAGIGAMLLASGDPTVPIPTFRDVAAEVGIDSLNVNGKASEKNYIPETKGGGRAFSTSTATGGWISSWYRAAPSTSTEAGNIATLNYVETGATEPSRRSLLRGWPSGAGGWE